MLLRKFRVRDRGASNIYAFAKNKIVIELIPTGVQDDTECMINPGFHFVVHSVDELIKLLKNINY